jgi:hypothetical protein
MDTTVNRSSATIYQFPVRERPLLRRRSETDSQSPARICAAAIDSGWYHDDAIHDERKARDTVVR